MNQHAQSEVFKIRYSKVMAAALIVFGALSLLTMFASVAINGVEETSSSMSLVWILGPGALGAGLVLMFMSLVKISPHEVRQGGWIPRPVAINGYGDLVLDGKKLRRRSDGKIVARLNGMLNRQDVDELKRRIGAHVS